MALGAALAVPAAAQDTGDDAAPDDAAPDAAALDAAAEALGKRLVDRAPEEVLVSARHRPADFPIPTPADVDAAIARGRRWMLTNQNEDGSYGGWANPGPYDDFWSNPYSHHGWIAATTGLVVMALLEQPETPEVRAALDRSVRFLTEQQALKRPNDWDVDNVWGMIYGLHAMAEVLHDGRYRGSELARAVERKADEYVSLLADYQSSSGGWGYYDFETLAKRPSWATSFATSACVVALHRAQTAGVVLPEGLLDRAVRAVARCRLPNGAYDYNVDAIPTPGRMEGINNVKGSLGRIQSCNYALALVGHPSVTHEDLLTGLDELFEHHRFLDVARRRPVPHEAYYANAGYFYFFAHFYAGKVLELLDPAERVRYAGRLAREVVKTQEDDGSMWDYYMQSYHRPYGTAFGLMALERTRPQWSEFGRGLPREGR